MKKKGLLTIIPPDRELLDRYGIDLEQIGVLLPEEWAVQIDGKRIVIALPPR